MRPGKKVHKAVIPHAIGTCSNHPNSCAWQQQHYPKMLLFTYFYYLFLVGMIM